MNKTIRISLAVALALGVSLPAQAGKNVRSSARANVNSNKNVNVNRNVNKNVNVNRDIDIDVDHHHHGGYYGGCCYHGGVGTAMAVTATAMVTAAVIGSMVNTLPSGCSTTNNTVVWLAVRLSLTSNNVDTSATRIATLERAVMEQLGRIVLR